MNLCEINGQFLGLGLEVTKGIVQAGTYSWYYSRGEEYDNSEKCWEVLLLRNKEIRVCAILVV